MRATKRPPVTSWMLRWSIDTPPPRRQDVIEVIAEDKASSLCIDATKDSQLSQPWKTSSSSTTSTWHCKAVLEHFVEK